MHYSMYYCNIRMNYEAITRANLPSLQRLSILRSTTTSPQNILLHKRAQIAHAAIAHYHCNLNHNKYYV